ncbi:hypothetical protein F511_27185 [Dorcoceras hygrometricum]|uniref:C2H2-type domain-containing protein n=1 Tax=Dorcoceras hygrometricum TaxID=472368 RepID=A0A2Z7CFU8_9LAMI|nr:hypothetical protein F511_27185 [Dorcoceras hygrometricum]
MAGRDLGYPRSSTNNLKEQLVRRTLRNVRAQGHPYVELREDGKRLIFFCTLCLAPCYGDSCLFNHLNGNLHTQRLATAKLTLLKPNPWPFSDGVFFFCNDLLDQNNNLPVSGSERVKLLDFHHVDGDTAIVRYGENLGSNACSHLAEEMGDHADGNEIPFDQNLVGEGYSHELVIPSVLQKDEVSNLVVRHMGVGRIGARFSKKDVVSDEIRKIWCEWLGNKELSCEDIGSVPDHDFSVVTFAYNYNLGRKGLLDEFRKFLPSSPHSEAEYSSGSRGKKRKSFSDSVDMSNQSDSSGEEWQSSNHSNMKMILYGNDDQQVPSRVLSRKIMRKQMREQEVIAAERSCDLCQQRMLPDKDVAALLNRKTGKFVCSSRNLTGAFHVFHISCLLHWVLLCEVEIYSKKSVTPKLKRRSRRKVKGGTGVGKRENCETQETRKQIYSVFCPECQGTGIEIDKEELEKPTISLFEIFTYKIKLCDAHKAWMKDPEVLQNCSIGFHFPADFDAAYQENVATLKLLHFYRADI